MKKTLIITLIIIVVIIACIFLYMTVFFDSTLYKIGNVKKNYSFSSVRQQELGEKGRIKVSDSIELYYFTEGKGTPILVLHGGPGYPYSTPKKTLSTLSDSYRFIYYHQRGSGLSTKPFNKFVSANYYQNMKNLEANLGIAANLADIEHFRRVLGLEKLILIGHSFGGFLATLYGAEYPEHLEKLVLAAPANLLKMPAEKGHSLYDAIEENLQDPSQKSDFKVYQKQLFDFGSIFKRSEKQIAELQGKIGLYFYLASKTLIPEIDASSSDFETELIGGWPFYAISFSIGKRCDYREALRSIKCPTLLIYGEKDLVQKENYNNYIEYLENISVKTLENSGHFLLDESQEAAKLIRDFLD